MNNEKLISDLESFICKGMREPKDLDLKILEWYIELKKTATFTQKTQKP